MKDNKRCNYCEYAVEIGERGDILCLHPNREKRHMNSWDVCEFFSDVFEEAANMKSVLISIKPNWCGLIVNGKKTVEIRKSRPKIDTPFKCYIYCTLSGMNEFFSETLNVDVAKYNREKWYEKKGKVIGEFICDEITPLFNVCTGNWELLQGNVHDYHKELVKQACLTEIELQKYANHNDCYAWHISDLVIYDTPKELGEFLKYNRSTDDCFYSDLGLGATKDCKDCMYCAVTRPPQSWCYVEEIKIDTENVQEAAENETT